MAQSSRQIQSQAQQQVQTLSPQQILAVRLLELPALELEERVHAELLDNPALEEGKESSETEDIPDENKTDENGDFIENEDLSLGDYRTEDDIPDYNLKSNNYSSDAERAADIPFSDTVSFFEVLKEQLNELDLNEHQHQLAEYIIGSLDDDGLLRKSLDSMIDELAIYAGVETTEQEMADILHIVQEFDPAGIGARSLKECLLLQINRKEENPIKQKELLVIEKCYEEFTKKHWEKIKQRLNITDEELKETIDELVRLNPRPGSSLGEAMGKSMQQIIPDFIIETSDDGNISLSLNNPNIPELRLSRTFTDMLNEHTHNKTNSNKESKDALLFLKQKIDAAQGFIDAVKQRHNTLLTTMQAIINLQRPFFLDGDESSLKPMILKDVAEHTGLDISTISRVCNNKYAQTNYGIYPLKYFFSDGYTTESGEELSVREIRKVLKECIDHEDKTNPLSDDELATILKEKGYPIARRTIAKYRKQLNIPVARLRK